MYEQRRYVTLDAIRLIACLMIVLMHSPMPGLGTPSFVLSGISYLTAPGIGLFFMVSGALLLKSNVEKPFGTKNFLRRRFTKILIPLVLWSLVGWGLEQYGVKNIELDILWFMYSLAGLYLLTPVLSRWLSVASTKEVEFYLFLWLATLCIPFVKLFVSVNETDTSWLYYFHGYVGYYVLGYYLHNCLEERLIQMRIWTKVLSIAIFLIVTIALPFSSYALHIEFDFYSLFWNLSITVVLQCVAWWILIKKSTYKFFHSCPMLKELSKLSFGIYLIHIIVMRNFLWKTTWMQGMNGIIQILVCTILTFTISALISFGLSKIKYARVIIGCK